MISEPEPEEISSGGGVPQAASPINRATKHPFKYVCPFCGKRYTSRSGLLSHKNTVHFQRKPYRCQICNAHFFTSASRVGHIRKEHPGKTRGLIRKNGGGGDEEEEEEEEDLCGEGMMVLGGDEQNKEEGGFVADVPREKETTRQAGARKSKETEDNTDEEEEEGKDEDIEVTKSGGATERISFAAKEQVDHCGPAISHDHEFPQQMAWIKESRDQYICTECRLSFQTADNLILHIDSHPTLRRERRKRVESTPAPRNWEENLLSCDLCTKTFCHPSWKKIHMKYHHPDAFRELGISSLNCKCQFCFERFQTASHKRLHESLSCGKAKFSCGLCLNKFRSVSSYARHIKQAHSHRSNNDGVFQCPLCQCREFESPYCDPFLDHLQEDHGGQVASFDCCLCEYSNESAKAYLQHLKSHSEADGKRITMYIE